MEEALKGFKDLHAGYKKQDKTFANNEIFYDSVEYQRAVKGYANKRANLVADKASMVCNGALSQSHFKQKLPDGIVKEIEREQEALLALAAKHQNDFESEDSKYIVKELEAIADQWKTVDSLAAFDQFCRFWGERPDLVPMSDDEHHYGLSL